ncbi:hypothetical protein GCM10022245_11960 [Streptomyces mayteni]
MARAASVAAMARLIVAVRLVAARCTGSPSLVHRARPGRRPTGDHVYLMDGARGQVRGGVREFRGVRRGRRYGQTRQ